MLDQPIRIVFQAGDDLAAIQPRRPLADIPGLDDAHRKPDARRMQGRRKPHDAAADNGHVDMLAGRQWLMQRH